eukprot:gene22467-29584_t
MHVLCEEKSHHPSTASGSDGAQASEEHLSSAMLRLKLRHTGVDVAWCLERAEFEHLHLRVDMAWCLERAEFEAVWSRFGKHLCGSSECAAHAQAACTRQLEPCGHWCVGVRGEQQCPPCTQCADLAASADASLNSLAEECCSFCHEPLRTAPCITLNCASRHMCHLHCAKGRLEAIPALTSRSRTSLPPVSDLKEAWLGMSSAIGAGPTRPRGLTFCASSAPCVDPLESRLGNVQVFTGQVHLDHAKLSHFLEEPLKLRSQVAELAKMRLKAEGLMASEPELRPGGSASASTAATSATPRTLPVFNHVLGQKGQNSPMKNSCAAAALL